MSLPASGTSMRPGTRRLWLARLRTRSCTLRNFPAYDRDKLEAALPELRSLTVEDPVQAIQRAQDLLRNCGVALTLVPAVPGLGTHGATRWIQHAWGHSLKRKVTITSLAA